MGSLKEILKALQESKDIEVGEDETKRLRITFKNGKMDVTVEAVPDLDALSLEQLYALQEEYEEKLDLLQEEEPDEDSDPEAFENWEDAIEYLEEDLDEIESKIEELQEEEPESDDD